jgi:NAD(P)-dependent dehydrogenase (short-subunit alcohol dehydrogenase family)
VRAEAIACDVTNPSQVQDLLSRVLDTFGRVDVLVNDAAYNKWIPFTDLDAMTYEEWQKILAVNLTGPMLCIKAVAPAMRQHGGGRIVNIASVAGLAPSGSSIPYAVSKAGLIHLTRCMAVSLAPHLVNCIAQDSDGTRQRRISTRVQRAPRMRRCQARGRQGRVASQVVALTDRQHYRANPGHRCGAAFTVSHPRDVHLRTAAPGWSIR